MLVEFFCAFTLDFVFGSLARFLHRWNINDLKPSEIDGRHWKFTQHPALKYVYLSYECWFHVSAVSGCMLFTLKLPGDMKRLQGHRNSKSVGNQFSCKNRKKNDRIPPSNGSNSLSVFERVTPCLDSQRIFSSLPEGCHQWIFVAPHQSLCRRQRETARIELCHACGCWRKQCSSPGSGWKVAEQSEPGRNTGLSIQNAQRFQRYIRSEACLPGRETQSFGCWTSHGLGSPATNPGLVHSFLSNSTNGLEVAISLRAQSIPSIAERKKKWHTLPGTWSYSNVQSITAFFKGFSGFEMSSGVWNGIRTRIQANLWPRRFSSFSRMARRLQFFVLLFWSLEPCSPFLFGMASEHAWNFSILVPRKALILWRDIKSRLGGTTWCRRGVQVGRDCRETFVWRASSGF